MENIRYIQMTEEEKEAWLRAMAQVGIDMYLEEMESYLLLLQIMKIPQEHLDVYIEYLSILQNIQRRLITEEQQEDTE